MPALVGQGAGRRRLEGVGAAGLALIRNGGVQPESRRPGKVTGVSLGVVAEPNRAVLFTVQPDGEAFVENLLGGIASEGSLPEAYQDY